MERPENRSPAKKAGAAALQAGLGLVLLCEVGLASALLSVHYWLPDYRFDRLRVPSPEALGVMLLLLLLAVFPVKRRPAAWVVAAAGALLAGLCLYSFSEAIVRHLYERSFEPAMDLPYLSAVPYMLFGQSPLSAPVVFWPLIAVIVLAVAAGFWLLSRLAIATVRAMPWPAAGAGAVVLCVGLWGLAAGYSEPLVDEMAAHAWPAGTAGTASPAEAPKAGAAAEVRAATGGGGSFTRLGRGNVLLFVVESYGYTAFSRPELFAGIEPLLRDFQDRLGKKGYSMYSTFLSAPVIGGWSWLADATLLTGRRIDKQEDYDALIQSGVPSLPRIFREAGYHTLLAAPGTVHGEDQAAGTFYRFEDSLLGPEFGYHGPMFSFVFVTDQFAVNYVHRHLLATRPDRPQFILYTLVSSHGPFNRIPPYVENWSELGDGSIYEKLNMLSFDNDWIAGRQYDEGYTAAISYVLTVLFEYLLQFIDDDCLVVIVGDHPPKFPVTRRGVPLSVPLHVLSRDAELLGPLSGMGYTAGLVPDQQPPQPGTETFFSTFLDLAGYKK
jgi:hypothetical protein